jgi:ferric-dicitrate binding protein FerR (iron transport regulator)
MFRRTTLTRTGRSLLIAAALVLSLAPLHAQDSSAKVIYQVGQVSLQNGSALDVLKVGDAVRVQQMIVTGPDGFAKLQVQSDGSTFEVYPNSRVIFRETPGAWDHLLNVWLGRVKVFIQHAPGVPNPNKVTSPTAVISVRGTVFDVVVQDADGTTFVSVDEGLVDVRNWTAPGNAVSLHPGESITVFRGQSLIGSKGGGAGDAVREMLRHARDLYLGVPRGGGNGPIGGVGGAGGAQGDKGKPTGGTGGTNAPGAPPGAPPAPGGGG